MSVRGILAKVDITKMFLLVVFLIYLAAGLTNPLLVQQSLYNFIQLALKIMPVLIIVFVFLFLSNLFLTRERTLKYLGHKSGLKGWLFAVGAGVLSAGPIYMWYPLLADLKEKGMKTSLIATFLYNRAVKLPLLPVMVYYFGWAFTLVLTLYMLIFSLLSGLVVGRLVKNKEAVK
jgi:uncharacterized membrane protein YraQ (UPF0718 family)